MTADEASRFRAGLRSHPRIAWGSAALPARRFERIVSLVPSLSEALVALGLGDRLVAVTEYCVEPPGAFDELPRVGGTKDADVAAIRALRPDLVIANQEENTARVVRALADAGIDVWVTYPRSVREGAELLRDLAALGASAQARAEVVEPVFAALAGAEARLAQARASGVPPVRVFCAIWRDPWMTIGRDTYIHDLIALCGGANVFADGPEGPGPRPGSGPRQGVGSGVDAGAGPSAARRYPIVDREAIERARPDVILLPSEPYAFSERDRAELLGLACPAAASSRVHLIDGTLVSWYGPRIAEAIRVLGMLLATS
jgi:ABC-type Fe3+-hydroxamate transport system substrate-binding protein